MKQQKGFFDENDRLARLTELGDSLEILNRVIDWDIFREFLDLNFTKKDKTERGRPPFDRVMMLKILILQRIYNKGLREKMQVKMFVKWENGKKN